MKLSEVANKNNFNSLEYIRGNELYVSTLKKCLINISNDKYDEWRIYSDSKLLERLVPALFNCIENWDSYNYLASLGSSGAPLTYNLSTKYNKNAIFINDEWGIAPKFQPVKPHNIEKEFPEKVKILLIDSILKSGLTVKNAIRTLKGQDDVNQLSIDVLVISVLPEFFEINLFDPNEYAINVYYLTHWNKDVQNLIVSLDNK